MLRDGPLALLSMRVGKGCAMNKPISAKDIQPRDVTTGPLAGSRKVYSAPQGHDDVKVPFREIALARTSTSFRVYDTSGPYTDAEAHIDVNRGLKPVRAELDCSARRHRGRWQASGDPARICARRDRHQGDDLCRAPREYRAAASVRGGRSAARRRRELRRVHPCFRDAGIRALAKSPAAAPSSPPTSITPRASR